MKSTLLFILAISVIISGKTAARNVTIHGKIKNPISDSISVSYSDSWIGYVPNTVASRLDKAGNFSLNFPLDHAFNDIFITHGNQSTELFLEPGDNLEMTLDAKNFDSTLQYTGKGAEAANFIAKHMLFSSFTMQFSALMNSFCKDGPDSFVTEVNTAMQKEIDFLNANGQKLTPLFKKYWKAFYQYHVYNIMLNYVLYHTISQQHSYSVIIPKENYILTSKVPPAFDDHLLPVSLYRYYIGMYYGEQMNARASINGQPKKDDSEEVAFSYKNMPPESAELYGASHVYDKMWGATAAAAEITINEYKSRYPKSAYLPWLEEKLAMKRIVAAGSLAPDFTINTIDGKTMKLSDLKGKVVYLDFWASWCGPCMAQMPAARKLEEKYKDKNIVFLYVSIDADADSWKKAMDKIKIDGIHMKDGDGGWTAPVATKFGVHGIPSYFLIDKEGKFAMSNTPDPSANEELYNEIDKLLE